MAKPRFSSFHENELVWQFFGHRTDGFFIDVGANDPKNGSQSWLLEQNGWRGLLVEPLPLFAEALRLTRPRSRVFQVACGRPGSPGEMPLYIAKTLTHSSLVKNLVVAEEVYIGTEMVRMATLDALLEKAGNPQVDFVSIDVEGTQLDVLHGFNLARHRPELLLIEDHLYNLKVHRYLNRQGYRLRKRTGLNNWYVPQGMAFTLASPLERLRLWKKLWLNAPFRKLRVTRKRRRAAIARTPRGRWA